MKSIKKITALVVALVLFLSISAPAAKALELSGVPSVRFSVFRDGLKIRLYSQIQYDSEGNDVSRLQELLQKLGYDCGASDGVFGARTQNAVYSFQTDHHLAADGIVGPKTWAAIAEADPSEESQDPGNETGHISLYYWDKGDEVKSLQEMLAKLGFDPGSCDGVLGPKTAAAVILFQKAHDLYADGNVNSYTWVKLEEALDQIEEQQPDDPGEDPGQETEEISTQNVSEFPVVKLGSEGVYVTKLQLMLNALNYSCGEADGVFGANTQAAVISFQVASGLYGDGTVDLITWAMLASKYHRATNLDIPVVPGEGESQEEPADPQVQDPQHVTLYYDDTGSAVSYLQTLLTNLGYECGTIDGVFGTKTYGALNLFKKTNGLVENGVCDEAAWQLLESGNAIPCPEREITPADQLIGPTVGRMDPQHVWNLLMMEIGNPAGVAAVMGNMEIECMLYPANLENCFNASSGMTDEEYTAAVDNGTYTNFVWDGYGYGLVMWTYWALKQGLLNYADATGRSIGNGEMQIEYLCQCLQEPEYIHVWNGLVNATSAYDACILMMTDFECCVDQSAAHKEMRGNAALMFYDLYAGK